MDVQSIVAEVVTRVNETLELQLQIDRVEPSDNLYRIHIKGRDHIAFLIRAATGTAAVVAPTDSCLLASKVRALFQRRYTKPGDLFDVWFLLSEGVTLDPEDRASLEDELADVDSESIDERFQRFRGEAWIRALTRSGVSGLTPETGAQVTETVRRFVSELIA